MLYIYVSYHISSYHIIWYDDIFYYISIDIYINVTINIIWD